MVKRLTTDQAKEYYDQIEKLPLHLTKLKYWELIEVWEYAQNFTKDIENKIKSLIQASPDYKGYPADCTENDKFEYWTSRYNAGQYNQAKKLCKLINDELLKAKKFQKKTGLKAYSKRNGGKPYFQFTDEVEIKSSNEVPDANLYHKTDDLKSPSNSNVHDANNKPSAPVIIMAYFYLKKVKNHPIKNFENLSVSEKIKSLIKIYGGTYNNFRNIWTPTYKTLTGISTMDSKDKKKELQRMNLLKNLKNVKSLLESMGNKETDIPVVLVNNNIDTVSKGIYLKMEHNE